MDDQQCRQTPHCVERQAVMAPNTGSAMSAAQPAIPLSSPALDEPAAITQLAALGRRFVVWREESRDGRPTKVPYQPNGRNASFTDPATWGTHEECRAAVPRQFPFVARPELAQGFPDPMGDRLRGVRPGSDAVVLSAAGILP